MKQGNYKRKCSDKYNRKKVLQYSLKQEFIKEWETVGEIFRELNFDKSAILRCCKGKQKKSYHFIWKFKDDVSFNNKKQEEKDNGSNSQKLPKTIHGVEGQG